MATCARTPSGDVVLCLTHAEARALGKLASEGASATLNDLETARQVLGSDAAIDAARRALDTIRSATQSELR